MSNYENAPATLLLATHCACCGRPLVDAISVETGIGPDCRRKYMSKSEGSDDAARIAANKIVYRLALAISSSGPKAVGAILADGSLDKLRSLGFMKLTDKLIKATMPIQITESDGMLVVRAPYDESAVTAQRAIPGRRWNAELKSNAFPSAQRAAVWSMLRRYYAGLAGIGPRGAFVVPDEERAAA
jgi:Family of unknown function (DUF6011)